MRRLTSRVIRILRALWFIPVLALSFIPVFFFFAWVTVGAWFESILHAIGWRSLPGWIPAVLGFLGYAGLGIAGPAVLLSSLIGWPAYIIGPIATLIMIAIVGKW